MLHDVLYLIKAAVTIPDASHAMYWDSNVYDGTNPTSTLPRAGLSEYTNANFLSRSTVFTEGFLPVDAHYFPYPKKTSTALFDEGTASGARRTYFSKERDGETVRHLAAAGKLYKYLDAFPALQRTQIYLDEKCHEDYASLLLPKAVGYSAGLLNYFFRGTLQISAPDSYVYSITDGSKTPYTHTDAQGNSYAHQQFTHIKAKVKNTTPKEKDVNGNPLTFEEMEAGTLVGVARYKIIPDYAADLSNAPPDGAVMSRTDYSYSVSLPIPIPSLSSTRPTEFTFDFTDSPIPAGITDLSFHVIFKGTLGSEADTAVAVGMKDLMEPTHHVFWNLTDMFSLTVDQYSSPYHLYTSEQIKATPSLAGIVDYDHDGIFNELDKGEPYIDPYDLTYEIGYAGVLPSRTKVFPSAHITLPPGRHVDRKQPNYIRMTWTQTIQTGTALMYATFQGAVNQTNNNAWTATPRMPSGIGSLPREHSLPYGSISLQGY